MTPPLGLLTFHPILVTKPWGGRALERFGKTLPIGELVGESWEIADLPDGTATDAAESHSYVASGPQRGLALSALIATYGSDFLGTATAMPDGAFALLVKLLDANEHLSIQVHPNAEYVARHSGAALKTESWYVLDARPGAVLYKGFRDGVSIADVAATAGTPAIVELLQTFDARPGDFHHLPAGVVHALGAGVVVAETQTPSDTTFRIYDWTEEYGREPRTLHITEALETLEMSSDVGTYLAPSQVDGTRLLVATDHYWFREHRHDAGKIALHDAEELRVLMVADGSVSIEAPGEGATVFPIGSTIVLPAVIATETTVRVVQPSVLLETGLVNGP